MITVTLNGDPVDLPGSVETLEDFLLYYQTSLKEVAIEYNGNIVSASELSCRLEPQSTIEMIRFIGGG